MIQALRIHVEGRVQGVWYRGWTQQVAQSLGLRGWCRNMTDGRVEIHAEGEELILKQLVARCP